MKHTFPLVVVGLSTLGLMIGCGGNKKSRSSTASAATSNSSSTSSNNSSSTGSSSADAPSIASIAPQSGPVDGGTAVTISGANFQVQGAGETIVLFGTKGVRATPLSDTQIQVTTPIGVNPGQVDLRVVNDLGTGIATGAFTYDPRPASLSFSPVVGHHELGLGGTRITLKVSSFATPLTAATTVTFGQTPATTVTLVDNETVVAEVPQGVTTGTLTITVDEAGQQVSVPGFLVQGALSYGDLTVNEVMANPGGIDTNQDEVSNSSGDEFVEIVNTTNSPIDLSYLTIWDGANIERHRFPNPTVIPAGGAIVVFGSGTPNGFKVTTQQATSGLLGLNNSGDTVEIRTLPGANPTGTTLFLMSWTTTPIGESLQNPTDGQKITANPATGYVTHSTLTGASGSTTPGKKADGTDW